jgi:hypothetical protein
MDLQALFDAIGAADRKTRSNYHMTLGRMIAELEKCDPLAVVSLSDDGMSPGDANSYRGYYSDLSFEPEDGPVSVEKYLRECRNALGETFEGYKGGDFIMGEDTPLWISTYGSASGRAIVGLLNQGEKIVLEIKMVD